MVSFTNPQTIYERAVTSCESKIEDRTSRGLNDKRSREIEVQEFLLDAVRFYHLHRCDLNWESERISRRAHEYVNTCPIVLEPITPEDGGGYYARCEKYPGLLGDGKSPNEAVEDYKIVLFDAVCRRIKSNLPLA